MAPILLAALAAATALPGTPVSDPELATMRGGFRLPGGIDVALTVTTQTSIDGALVLRSVFRADDGKPTLAVFAPAPGQTLPTERSGAAAGGAEANGTGNVTVQFDRQNGATLISGAPITPNVTVAAGPPADTANDGLQVLDTSAGAVQTAAGAVSVRDLPTGTRVQLEGGGVDVSHLYGNAFGSAIANSASNRAIDTDTTIALDLRNAGADVLGSTMFRVENVALESARMLTR